MGTLEQFTGNRDNNFNLLRFAAATAVLFSHSYPLSGAVDPLWQKVGISFGEIAVDMFFIVSGFLVFASLLVRKSTAAFLWARAVRIYPALIVSVWVSVILIGFFITTAPLHRYFFCMETLSFIGKNTSIVFGTFDHLPGAFKTTPFRDAVNGSLWTLPWEIRMYGVLLLLGMLTYSWKLITERVLRHLVLAIGVCAVAAYTLNHFLPFTSNRTMLLALRLVSMFFMGATLYVIRGRVQLSAALAAAMLVSLAAASVNRDLLFILYTVCIPYLTVCLAYAPGRAMRHFNSVGDYSYGLYIYAFPVQQSVASLVPGISTAGLSFLSFVVTLAFAVCSWHLVEKRMLARKNDYVVLERRVRHLLGRVPRS